MPVYGLTTDGLIVKTLNVIREELNQRLRDAFGNSINLGDRAVLGQITGIVSELAALVWELAEAVNSAQDPDKASGAALDALCTLTGTFRPNATYSTVTLTLTGTPTTLVDAESRAKTTSSSVHFQTEEDATIDAVPAWADVTVYALGDRVTNSGNVYQCVVAGTSDASAPTSTDEEIENGTVTWTYLGAGTGAVDVLARATETGSLVAGGRDINIIETTIAGWDGVINLLDATVGREVASDEELRQLRELELGGQGNTTINAIRAALLKIEDVISVTVFVNNTDDTVDGVPPHAIEALVRPDTPVPDEFDQTVFDTLLDNVAAGILTSGNTSGTSVDSQGTSHTMSYSRPTEVPIYIIVNVTKDPDTYPADGDDLIKQAIVDWGDEQDCGKNAVASAITAQAFNVEGVLDVTAVKLGTAPAPTLSVTIPISLRELATYDTTRISVVSVDGTP